MGSAVAYGIPLAERVPPTCPRVHQEYVSVLLDPTTKRYFPFGGNNRGNRGPLHGLHILSIWPKPSPPPSSRMRPSSEMFWASLVRMTPRGSPARLHSLPGLASFISFLTPRFPPWSVRRRRPYDPVPPAAHDAGARTTLLGEDGTLVATPPAGERSRQ